MPCNVLCLEMYWQVLAVAVILLMLIDLMALSEVERCSCLAD